MYTVTIYYMYHMLFGLSLYNTIFIDPLLSSSSYNFITQNPIQFVVDLCNVFVFCQPYIIMYVHVYVEYYVDMYISG